MTLSQSAYRALRGTGWPALRRRHRAAVFCFHNVVEEAQAAADSSLHLPVDHWIRLLDWMAETYEILPLENLLERSHRGQSVGGLAAITVDDGYRGFLRLGLPALVARRLPATLFVVSGSAETPTPFWWDLAGAQARLDNRFRQEALTRWSGQREAVIGGLGLEAKVLPSDCLPADWETLSRASGEGLTFGCHTKTHPNLTAIGEAAVAEEFESSMASIADRLGIGIDTVSYPYGLVDRAVRERAKAAGFRFGLALGSEPLIAGADPFAIPRINVPANVTVEKLECWATGLRWNKPR